MQFFKKSIKISLILLILIVSLSFVSAHENTTDIVKDKIKYSENIGEFNNDLLGADSHIEIDDGNYYYKEKNTLVGYLKDTNGTAIKNKQVDIFLNEKHYIKTSDDSGKISLPMNLKPNSYALKIKFAGDENYTANSLNSIVKVKKPVLAIEMSNYKTYVDSDLFFKVKVYNKLTGNPISGIKVLFKVYSLKDKKYYYYYATTDKKGFAILNRNLKVGTYKISTQIKDSKNKKYVSYKNSNKKVTMKVKPTAETGCCSFYLQVNSKESVAGFRRDATNALNIYIKHVKWHGRTAMKQYKLGNSYFFHSITTSDGWMIGTGGIDNPSINKAIENLAGKMVEEKKIKKSYIKKIQNYERQLGLGHFSIKAPNGKFAVVWLNGYSIGKLNPGEYISVPNLRSYYRHGDYDQFSSNFIKAAIKVGATDSYGVNRRDITIFHWKMSTDKNFKTTSLVKTYASNDAGNFVGRSTSYLKDDIYYKNKFISKNNLPNSPKMLVLGVHKFGNIDKFIKTLTIVKAPSVTAKFNESRFFKVLVKNKKTKEAISSAKIKIKLSFNGTTKYYTLRTNDIGIAKINTKDLSKGAYRVDISQANKKYLISAKTKIIIK